MLIGYFIASLEASLWLDHKYISSRPEQSDPTKGLVHLFDDNGRRLYITHPERAEAALAFWGFCLAGVAVVIIVPKEFEFTPASGGTLRRITHIRTGLEEFRWAYIAILLASTLCSALLIVVAGPAIAGFVAGA